MSYLINILSVLFWPFLFSIGELILALVVNYIYKGSYNLVLLVLLTLIIFLPIFLSQIKKYNIKIKITDNLKSIPMMAISLALGLNILIILINRIFGIENVSGNSLILMTILSGIIGPVLEELLFRGIVFEKLKKFNSLKKTLIISVLIFSICHSTFVQMIYAGIVGYIITKLYIKTNNLLVSILFHICSNLIIGLIFNILIILPNYLLISFMIFFSLEFYYLYKRFMV